jgi:hypothetical protein
MMKHGFRIALGCAAITVYRTQSKQIDTTNVLASIVRAMGDARVHTMVTVKDVREDLEPWIAQVGKRRSDDFRYDLLVASAYKSTGDMRKLRGAEWQMEMDQCTKEEARGKIALNRVLEELYPESTITRYAWTNPATMRDLNESWKDEMEEITKLERIMRTKSNAIVFRVLQHA